MYSLENTKQVYNHFTLVGLHSPFVRMYGQANDAERAGIDLSSLSTGGYREIVCVMAVQ